MGQILILGIGNTLMGDEGIGVHVVRRLHEQALPAGVECLDGGTGSFILLGPMQEAGRIILIDATIDGQPTGTVRRLTPKFSRDYPRTLTAHDIGLKDLLDAFYLLGRQPEVILYAISIAPPHEVDLELSPELQERIPHFAALVVDEVNTLLG